MRASPGKCLGVVLKPEVFRALAHHSRRHEMTPRVFLAHMAGEYVAAMRKAEAAIVGTSPGR